MEIVYLGCCYDLVYRDYNGRPKMILMTMMEIPGWAYAQSLENEHDLATCFFSAKFMLGLIEEKECLLLGPTEPVKNDTDITSYGHSDIVFGDGIKFRGGGQVSFSLFDRTVKLYGGSYEFGEAILTAKRMNNLEVEFKKIGFNLLVPEIIPEDAKSRIIYKNCSTVEKPEKLTFLARTRKWLKKYVWSGP